MEIGAFQSLTVRRRHRRRMRAVASAITAAVVAGSIGVVADTESGRAPKVQTEASRPTNEDSIEQAPAVVRRSVQAPEAISRAS